VVAKPYRIPDASNWVGDLDGLTAIGWTPTLSAPGVLLDRVNGYVAAEWAGIAVVAVYVSLDTMGECQDYPTRKMADQLGRGPGAPSDKQGLGEYLREVEGVIRSGHYQGHLGVIPEDPRLESRRGGRDVVRSPLRTRIAATPGEERTVRAHSHADGRRFSRARRRRQTRDEEEISRTYEAYREAKRTLQRKIKIAKARS
jgi:hypothetical protein